MLKISYKDDKICIANQEYVYVLFITAILAIHFGVQKVEWRNGS